jgi:heme/copper-type cytochrome/quinol oxidase subunit 4
MQRYTALSPRSRIVIIARLAVIQVVLHAQNEIDRR